MPRSRLAGTRRRSSHPEHERQDVTDGARGEGSLDGPVDQWVDTLVAWTRAMRIDAFVVWPPDAGSAMVERLAAEVVPAVRAALDADRA